jgi:WD40 repeat protein
LADALGRARALRVALDSATAEETAMVDAAAARITADHAESVAGTEASVRERHGADGSPRGEFETEDHYAARIAVYREGLPAFIAEWTPVRERLDRERDDAMLRAREDAEGSSGAAGMRAELRSIEETAYRVEVNARIGAYRTEDAAFPVMLSHDRWPVPSDAVLSIPLEDAERVKRTLSGATVTYGIKDGVVVRRAMWIGEDRHPLRAAEWTRVRTLAGHPGPVTGAVFISYNRVLTSGADGRLVLWDSGTGRQVRAIDAHSGAVKFLRSVVNARHVVSATNSEIKVWDARTLAPFATIAGDDLTPDAPGASDAEQDGHSRRGSSTTGLPNYGSEPMSRVSAVALSGSPGRVAYGLVWPVRRVVVWDAEDEAVVAVIGGFDVRATSLAFAPSGEYLAAGLQDGRVMVWRVRERVPAPADLPERARRMVAPPVWRDCEPRELRSVDAHEKAVGAIAFTPDGLRVVSGSYDRTAKLWDVASGDLVQTFAQGHSAGITSLAVRRGGRRLVTGSLDGLARLWDVSAGRGIRSYRGHDGPVQSVSFGVGLLTASTDGSARLWKSGTGWEQRAFRGHVARAQLTGLSEDGRRLLTASTRPGARPDRNARLWNLNDGKQVAELSPSGRVALHPDGRIVAAPAANGVVRLYSGHDGSDVGAFSSSYGGVVRVQFTDRGRQYLITATGQAAELREVEHPDTARSLLEPRTADDDRPTGWFGGLSGDGGTLATVSSPKLLHLWDAETGKSKGSVTIVGDAARTRALRLNHDGSRLLTYALRDRARLWDVATHEEFPLVAESTAGCRAAAFSNDGTLLITGSNTQYTAEPDRAVLIQKSHGVVKLWSAETGALIRDLPTQPDSVSQVSFSGDDARVIVRSGTAVRVYEVSSGAEVASLNPSVRYVDSAAVSYDGTLVVTIATGVIDVWRPVIKDDGASGDTAR